MRSLILSNLATLIAPVFLGAQAAPLELAGVRLGTPLKEAMQALRSHNRELKVAPDALPVGGKPLTFGVNAVGGGEGFYLLLTTPPAEPKVSKVTWVRHFQEEPPHQDAVVKNLAAQYGQPSYDTLAASLTLGSRELFWVRDEAGHRAAPDAFQKCRGQSTFFMNGSTVGNSRQYDPVSVRLPAGSAKLRLEQGYTNATDRLGGQCGGFTMVRARLFRSRVMGVAVPNLVEFVVLMIASGPLDRDATEATHQHFFPTRK